MNKQKITQRFLEHIEKIIDLQENNGSIEDLKKAKHFFNLFLVIHGLKEKLEKDNYPLDDYVSLLGMLNDDNQLFKLDLIRPTILLVERGQVLTVIHGEKVHGAEVKSFTNANVFVKLLGKKEEHNIPREDCFLTMELAYKELKKRN